MQKQLGLHKLETVKDTYLAVRHKSNIQKIPIRDSQQTLYLLLSFPQSFSSMNDLSSCFRTKNGFNDLFLMNLIVYWSGKSSMRNMGGQDEFATTTLISPSMLHRPHSHHKLFKK